jgi:hypothetical protein
MDGSARLKFLTSEVSSKKNAIDTDGFVWSRVATRADPYLSHFALFKLRCISQLCCIDSFFRLSQLDLVNRSFAPPNIKTTSKEGSSEHLLQLTKQRHLLLNSAISRPGLAWPTSVRIS